jgi:hypothetical protein
MVSVSLEVMVGPGEVDVGRAIRLLIEARVGSIVHRYNLTLETTSFGIRAGRCMVGFVRARQRRVVVCVSACTSRRTVTPRTS